MTRGGKQPGAGRPNKYYEKPKDLTLTWPPTATAEAKKLAAHQGLSLSAFLLWKVFGDRYLVKPLATPKMIVKFYKGNFETISGFPENYVFEVRDYGGSGYGTDVEILKDEKGQSYCDVTKFYTGK